MATLLGILGIEEVAIHRMTFLIYLKFNEITVYLVGTVFLGEFLGVTHRNILQFVPLPAAKCIEIPGSWV